MKKLSSIFAVLAFVFAIGVSFANVLMQTDGYYYSGGAVHGPTDLDGEVSCGVEGSTICTIGDINAFVDETSAENNAGGTSSSAPGLLKRD